MIEVGTYEAKTRFSELLDQALRGEIVVITRHGKRVARLVPEESERRARGAEVVEAIRKLRSRQQNVAVEEILAMRHEGHRI
jgi:prevent-host-death family protein